MSCHYRGLADRLEYLGLSSQWQRAIALIRHSPMKAVSEASAWQLMNTAVGLALVMREANRADYGNHALGVSLSWSRRGGTWSSRLGIPSSTPMTS